MKIESIKELKVICQVNKRDKPKRLIMFGYLFHRDISIYFTKAILALTHKKINPNIISLAGIFLLIIGSILLFSNLLLWNLVGVAVFYLSFILDKVDGEVARYLRRGSLRGTYLEQVYHFLFEPLFFAGVGIKLSLVYGSPLHLVLAGILMMLFIFATASPSFVHFILLYKRITNLKGSYDEARAALSLRVQKILRFLGILKFTTITARSDITLVIFFMAYIVNHFFIRSFLAFAFFVYVILMLLRVFRLSISQYLTIDKEMKAVVDELYRNI